MTQNLLEAMTKTVISVFVTEDVKKRLQELADKEKRSMSQMASILIDEALGVRARSQN